MALPKNYLTDGFTSLERGMNGGSATNLLPRNQYSFAMNVTARSGYVNNRPGWTNLPLSFKDDEAQSDYKQGKWQGAGWYVPDSGNPYCFVSISGRIYRLIVNTYVNISVEDLTLSGDPNMSTLPRAWFCQADKFMVIQDGVDGPLIWDGNALRRSQTDKSTPQEVPTGTAMAYGYGRLWLVRGKNVEAGDIQDAAIPNSPINFSEVLQKQDAFAVPITSGEITAIIFGANIDTSLGQGPLQLHTESGQITTLNVTVDRDSWTTTNIQVIGLVGGSSMGQDAVVNVNNDTWFRSHDGLRSFIVARRDFGTWGNTPQSREVNNILDYDTPSLLAYASGVWFSNRLLMTLSPQLSNGHRYFQGLSVLDFDLLSTLDGSIAGTNPRPAYDGIWSGLNISQITKTFFGSQERCFLFTWDETEGNGVWELSQSAPFDNGSCPIQSWIETGSMNFNNLTNLKTLMGADFWRDLMQKGVSMQVSFAPDQYPFWIPWQSWDDSDGQLCGALAPRNDFLSCQVPINNPTQYRSQQRIQRPIRPGNGPETDYPLDQGYDFRFRIDWTGRARIKGFKVFAEIQNADATGKAP